MAELVKNLDSEVVIPPETGEKTPNIVVVSLREQVRNIQPIPLSVRERLDNTEKAKPIDELFTFDDESIVYIHDQINTFLSRLPEDKQPQYRKFLEYDSENPPQIGDILIFVNDFLHHATGDHKDDLGIEDFGNGKKLTLQECLSLDTQPPTVCRIFNRETRAVFQVLANMYNRQILKTHQLIQTGARYVLDVFPSDFDHGLLQNYDPLKPEHMMNHTFLTLVSFDSNRGVAITPFDPYHLGQAIIPSPEIEFDLLDKLDFSTARSTDSFVTVSEGLLGNLVPGGGLFSIGEDWRINLPEGTQFSIAENSARVFPEGIQRLANAVFVASAMNEFKDTRLTKLRNRVASEQKRMEDIVIPQFKYEYRDSEGLLIEPRQLSIMTSTEIAQLKGFKIPLLEAEIAEREEVARKTAKANIEAAHRELIQQEQRYEEMATYVTDTINLTLQRGVAISPLEFVSLARLIDVTASSSIPLGGDIRNKALLLFRSLKKDRATLQALAIRDEIPSQIARARAGIEGIYLPQYPDEKMYKSWEDIKVAYFTLLVSQGISGWIDNLPSFQEFRATYEKNADEHILSLEKIEERYKLFIKRLGTRLRREGLAYVVSKIDQRVSSGTNTH